jgi:AbrB family looped-hinge helix DNA binding protein
METAMPLIKISKNYQIRIPVKLRTGFNLKEGDYLEASVKDGAFILKPVKVVEYDQDVEAEKAEQSKAL